MWLKKLIWDNQSARVFIKTLADFFKVNGGRNRKTLKKPPLTKDKSACKIYLQGFRRNRLQGLTTFQIILVKNMQKTSAVNFK